MKKILRILYMGLLALMAGVSVAQTDNATAEGLLRKSGFWEQMGSISKQVEAGLMDSLSQAGAKPSASEVERISRVIRETYAGQRLQATSVRVVSSKLDARFLADLQAWYDSPNGREVRKREVAAAAEEGDPQKMLQQGVELLGQSTPQRRKLLEAMLVETRAAEALTQIVINTTLAAQRGAASVLPHAPAVSPAELRAVLEAQRPQMLKVFSAMLLATFAQVYEPLSTELLAAYVSFLQSSAGGQFNTVCNEALDAALTEAALELGKRLTTTKDQANT